MPEEFTLKQDYGIVLVLIGGVCLLAAGMFYARNFSDAIHLCGGRRGSPRQP